MKNKISYLVPREFFSRIKVIEMKKMDLFQMLLVLIVSFLLIKDFIEQKVSTQSNSEQIEDFFFLVEGEVTEKLSSK